MPTSVAACVCGRLTASCSGDPAHVSLCHCLACHSGRQASSVSSQTAALGPAMASAGEADCGHVGGEGGIDTRRAVLDDETAVRRRHKVLCGV